MPTTPAQLTPNKQFSLPEDVAIIHSLNIERCNLTCHINRLTDYPWFVQDCPKFLMKSLIPKLLHPGIGCFSVLHTHSGKINNVRGLFVVGTVTCCSDNCSDCSSLFNSVRMQLVLPFMLCSHPRVLSCMSLNSHSSQKSPAWEVESTGCSSSLSHHFSQSSSTFCFRLWVLCKIDH